MSSTHTNKVQTTLTDYIVVEKLGTSSNTDNITNKKRKTISGEVPNSKWQTSDTNQVVYNPIMEPTPTNVKPSMQPTPTQEGSDWDSLCEEDK